MRKLLVLFLIISVSACQKKNRVPTSGEATINSDRILSGSAYSIQGFSFATGSVILYNPGSPTNIPDLFVLPIADTQGNATGAYFDSPNQYESFSLVNTLENADEALQFFNSYLTVDVSDYTSLANPLLINQVWVFKTNSGNFAKLLILRILNQVKDATPYAEVRFKWVYQPDGSTKFPQ